MIIAGYGRVGQIVARILRAQRIPFTALESSVEQVDLSRRFGSNIYFGDPSRPELLRAARADQAEVFVLATDDPETNLRTARMVKRLYPHLKIVARARNRQHAFRLMDLNVARRSCARRFIRAWRCPRMVLEDLGIGARGGRRSRREIPQPRRGAAAIAIPGLRRRRGAAAGRRRTRSPIWSACSRPISKTTRAESADT